MQERNTYLQHRQKLKLEDKPTEVKKPARIKPRSDKRMKEHREYVKIVKEKFEESDRCELMVVGVCLGKANGLHHLKKRAGALLLDRRYLKRACNACNYWCEVYPLEAAKLGLSLSKFN